MASASKLGVMVLQLGRSKCYTSPPHSHSSTSPPMLIALPIHPPPLPWCSSQQPVRHRSLRKFFLLVDNFSRMSEPSVVPETWQARLLPLFLETERVFCAPGQWLSCHVCRSGSDRCFTAGMPAEPQ